MNKSRQSVNLNNDNRMIKVTFRLSPDEYEFVKQKAKLSGVKNLSCYLRKMAVTGRIIKYNGEEFSEIKKGISRIGNNVNQIAVRVNKTGTIYYDDFQEIKSKVNEIWQSVQSIQSTLHMNVPSAES